MLLLQQAGHGLAHFRHQGLAQLGGLLCRLLGGALAGAHQAGQVFLADAGVEETVDELVEAFHLAVAGHHQGFFDPGEEHGQADGDGGNLEGVADALDQLPEAAPHHVGAGGNLEVGEADDEAGKGAEDADAGEDARQVLVELGPQGRIHQGLFGEEAFRQGRGAPAGAGLGAGRVQGLGVFAPQVGQGRGAHDVAADLLGIWVAAALPQLLQLPDGAAEEAAQAQGGQDEAEDETGADGRQEQGDDQHVARNVGGGEEGSEGGRHRARRVRVVGKGGNEPGF